MEFFKRLRYETFIFIDIYYNVQDVEFKHEYVAMHLDVF